MDLGPIVDTLIRWRITASLIVSIAAALILSNLFDWFTAKYAVGLVLCSVAVSMVWQARSEAGGHPTPTPKLSKPVAFLALAFFGIVAGALIARLSGSFLLATLVLGASPPVVYVWRALVEKQEISIVDTAFWTFSILSAWSVLLALWGSSWLRSV